MTTRQSRTDPGSKAWAEAVIKAKLNDESPHWENEYAVAMLIMMDLLTPEQAYKRLEQRGGIRDGKS